MKLLYDTPQIRACISQMALSISADYAGKNPLLVGILKGCVVFMAHLLVEIRTDVEIDFMTLSSYKHGLHSEELKLIQDLDTDVSGRDVLIGENIIDTGKTVSFVRQYLLSKGAKSVEIATLIRKSHRHLPGVP